MKEGSRLIPRRRALWAEGTAHAKSLRQDQEWRGQCGWNRRAGGKSDREGAGVGESWGHDMGS